MIKRMGKHFTTGLALMLMALMFTAACQDNKAVPDNVIMNQAKQALSAYQDLEIAIKDGMVTLTGTVPTAEAQKAAADLVSKIPGVKSVSNKLEVAAPVEPPAEGGQPEQNAGEYLDDSVITTQVKGALAANVSLSSLDIKVSTLDKVVTLSGEVKNQEIIDLAVKVAGEVNGVKSVDNQLTIAAQ